MEREISGLHDAYLYIAASDAFSPDVGFSLSLLGYIPVFFLFFFSLLELNMWKIIKRCFSFQ